MLIMNLVKFIPGYVQTTLLEYQQVKFSIVSPNPKKNYLSQLLHRLTINY